MAKHPSPPVPIFRATFYTDKSLGQLGLGRLSDVGRAKGAVQAYHRANLTEDGEAPYAVANDFIGSQIGHLLGLPIPPGAITRSEIDKAPIYSCLDFDWTAETLVSAEPDHCVRDLLEECTKLVLFDIWIANPDRLPQNLKANDVTNPTFLRVYDHADALFNVEGIDRLNYIQLNSLGLNWPNRRDREYHYLLEHLSSGEYREVWLDRIKNVPDFQIADICNKARAAGITEKEADSARDFLIYRKRNLEGIIDRNQQWFHPSFFTPWSLK